MEERIARLLEHYFGLLFRKAGLVWTSDNIAEMRELAGLITAIAEQAARDRHAGLNK